MIDDSELFHGNYDPAKAREYYLRTRKLKGRKKGVRAEDGSRVPAGFYSKTSSGKSNRANTKSRRAELKAQKVALQKRLDRLREVLKQKVKEAKATNKANAPKKVAAKVSKAAAPSTSTGKATSSAGGKKTKALTSTQKSQKAKAAKKQYEKEHPTSLSDDVQMLREQVKDIQTKIQKAVLDAKPHKKNAGKPNAALVRPKAK